MEFSEELENLWEFPKTSQTGTAEHGGVRAPPPNILKFLKS